MKLSLFIIESNHHPITNTFLTKIYSKANSDNNVLWTLFETEILQELEEKLDDLFDDFYECHLVKFSRVAQRQTKTINLYTSAQTFIHLIYYLLSTHNYITISDYAKNMVVDNIWLYNLSFRHAVFI